MLEYDLNAAKEEAFELLNDLIEQKDHWHSGPEFMAAAKEYLAEHHLMPLECSCVRFYDGSAHHKNCAVTMVEEWIEEYAKEFLVVIILADLPTGGVC